MFVCFLLVCFCFCRVFWFLSLFVGWFSFTQCNSCFPTARGSWPLTRAGTFSGQSTFSDRRSFVRVAAVAQKKNSFTQCNSCLPTARGSLPLTRAGIFTEQSTFSDRRSFVRVAAVAQKKKQPCVENLSVLINNSFSLMSTFNFTHTHNTFPTVLELFSCSYSEHLTSSECYQSITVGGNKCY